MAGNMNQPRSDRPQPLCIQLPNGRFVACKLEAGSDRIELQRGHAGLADSIDRLSPQAAFHLGEQLMKLSDLSG